MKLISPGTAACATVWHARPAHGVFPFPMFPATGENVHRMPIGSGIERRTGRCRDGRFRFVAEIFFENFQGSSLISGYAGARDYAGWSYILIGQVEGGLNKGEGDLNQDSRELVFMINCIHSNGKEEREKQNHDRTG